MLGLEFALPNTSVSAIKFTREQSVIAGLQDLVSWPPVQRPVSASAELSLGHSLLEDIAKLPNNWDGYGAPAIPSVISATAARTIEGLLAHVPLPLITPNSNATLSFEWEAVRGVAHLEIGSEQFSFFLKRVDGQPPLYMDGPIGQMSPDWFGQVILERLFSIRYQALVVGDFRFAVDVYSQ